MDLSTQDLQLIHQWAMLVHVRLGLYDAEVELLDRIGAEILDRAPKGE
jgi:hypothetical protein